MNFKFGKAGPPKNDLNIFQWNRFIWRTSINLINFKLLHRKIKYAVSSHFIYCS